MACYTLSYSWTGADGVALPTPQDKAKQLFLRFCTKKQREEYYASKIITVVGSKGGLYTVNCNGGYIANIRRSGMKEVTFLGLKFTRRYIRESRKYCMHLYTMVDYPIYDHFLAQKMLIEIDEEQFLKTAY